MDVTTPPLAPLLSYRSWPGFRYTDHQGIVGVLAAPLAWSACKKMQVAKINYRLQPGRPEGVPEPLQRAFHV